MESCTAVWMATWEISKYFQNSILFSEQNNLVNAAENTVHGSFKGEFKGNTR